ncbi:multicopper oxidase family protein [Nitrosospira sp. Nsp13]|uniref:multicopper oxidase family protein n=1 Tax=Nitrosospira sp. Nsp13 TaxID=1855332 RepID=UPI00087F97EC|nr:multicopper oxidase domain-containing protein [Nitrosospira sp. Nsp13]SCY38436.1 suppressor of ftsI/bilirubin oxidase [Nitrosospira sp. Nsp13]
MKYLDHKRRQFLQYALAGTVAAALPNFARTEDRYILNTEPDPSFKPDVEIEFVAQIAEVPILHGAHTSVFKYEGKVLRGPQSALKTMPSYLGPIMRLTHGQKVRIFYYNKLPEPSIMHWHGMHVPQKMDGHPMSVIEPGERYVYEFEVKNPAGINWYHAHPHDMTGPQVYRGQAGLITVTDEEEQKLGLPDGEYDIPLIIQDRRFTAGNQLQYIFGMHERMTGFLGDTILVNGQADTVIPVKTRAYRVRVLNGSNSRIYKLGWEDGTPLTAIGTDGGLLEAPQTRPYIMLAPAERVELWVDFSGRKPGTDLWLRSLEYELPQMGAMGMGGGMGGMRGGRMGGMGRRGPALGESISVAKFHISGKVSESPKLPKSLVKMRKLTDRGVSNPDRPVPIAATMGHMSAQLNGRSFEMFETMDIERIPVNTIQKIRITNEPGGMGGGMGGMRGGRMGGMGMMATPHPIHLHGQQFRVVSRTMTHEDTGSYATVREGFINGGWKDTVLVMPGEEIDIIKPFEDYTGLFLYHCHNLEHEDLGMMRNFHVS